MQPARHSIRQHVVPHTHGAIGSVTREEASANLRAQLFIVLTAPTARSCQPGIEAAPRDTERPAQPSRRPDHPVRRLRKKVEMLFAHLKRILKLDRLRLRGPNGARDEFLLAATVQNLRKLAKLIPIPNLKPA